MPISDDRHRWQRAASVRTGRGFIEPLPDARLRGHDVDMSTALETISEAECDKQIPQLARAQGIEAIDRQLRVQLHDPALIFSKVVQVEFQAISSIKFEAEAQIVLGGSCARL